METTTDTKSTIILFDRANSQLQNTIFQLITSITYAFSPVVNKSLPAALLKKKNLHVCPFQLVCHIALLSPLLKHTTHWFTVLISTVWSLSTFRKHWWMSMAAIVSKWRNLMTHLCFILTSVSDTIPSGCPSAAICHTATKCNGLSFGRFSLYCHIISIHLCHNGPS